MPLGFFGGSNSGVKPHPLPNQSPVAGGSTTSEVKGTRGNIVQLPKHTVSLEKKLAEGGFAIVYLVSDKSNRHFALKRQFISDDPRQLEACKRECRIVSCLAGHKNIVEYVDHLITRNRSGVYEYSLLTAYYKNSVLQLMNDRLLAGRCLSANEILAIFCDMCEAVARLHHSQTPVIHRDLKVENVLIDERCRSSPPRYVLCDFGSATTKVLSSETHSHQFIEDEIQRYTTLSYRAPEMVDLYSGRPIGTKSDIWALGVMLYKLCYFVLPFGESALAIQNCSFSFPAEPEYPDELRAIIKMLLDSDVDRRPDIFQVSGLAFEAASRRSPVGNLNKVRTIPLSEALLSLADGSAAPDIRLQRADDYHPAEKNEPDLLHVHEQTSNLMAGVTSVNPRLRPKPSSTAPRFPKALDSSLIIPSPEKNFASSAQYQFVQKNSSRQHSSLSSPDIGPSSQSGDGSMSRSEHSGSDFTTCHDSRFAKARVYGFKDLEDSTIGGQPSVAVCTVDSSPVGHGLPLEGTHSLLTSSREHASIHASAPQLSGDNHDKEHCRPRTASQARVDECETTAGQSLRSSAFKPYSATNSKEVGTSTSSKRDIDLDTDVGRNEQTDRFLSILESDAAKWNPFAGAPFDICSTQRRATMDDRSFGRCFDELPRKTRRDSSSSTQNVRSQKSLVMAVDESDPFGAAPFNKLQLRVRRASGNAGEQEKSSISEMKQVNVEKNGCSDELDSIGSTSDLRFRMHSVSGGEEESDCDEVRKQIRRRFSYEHFDGVGDNASSESLEANDDCTSDDDDTKVKEGLKRSTGESAEEFLCRSEGNTARPLLDDVDDLEENSSYIHGSQPSIPSSSASILPISSSALGSLALEDSACTAASEHCLSEQTAQSHAKTLAANTIAKEVSAVELITNPFAAAASIVQRVEKPKELSSDGTDFNVSKETTDSRLVTAAVQFPSPNIQNELLSESAFSYSNTAVFPKISSRAGKHISSVTVCPSETLIEDARHASPQPPQSAPAVAVGVGGYGTASRNKVSSVSTTTGAFDAITAFISPREKSRTRAVASKGNRRISSSSSSSGDSLHADDSGAEIFLTGSRSRTSGSTVTHRKKSGHTALYAGGSGLCLRSSSPAVEPTSGSVKLSPLLKKCSGKRHGSTSSKRSAQGMLDAASFVNNSFQAEDWESKPNAPRASPRSSLTQLS